MVTAELFFHSPEVECYQLVFRQSVIILGTRIPHAWPLHALFRIPKDLFLCIGDTAGEGVDHSRRKMH